MNIGIQGGNKIHLVKMRFILQHALVQMGNGPAQGNIKVKQLRQRVGGLLGVGVSPGLEG